MESLESTETVLLEAFELGKAIEISNRSKQEYEFALRQVDTRSERLMTELGSSTAQDPRIFSYENGKALLATPNPCGSGWIFTIVEVLDTRSALR